MDSKWNWRKEKDKVEKEWEILISPWEHANGGKIRQGDRPGEVRAWMVMMAI